MRLFMSWLLFSTCAYGSGDFVSKIGERRSDFGLAIDEKLSDYAGFSGVYTVGMSHLHKAYFLKADQSFDRYPGLSTVLSIGFSYEKVFSKVDEEIREGYVKIKVNIW